MNLHEQLKKRRMTSTGQALRYSRAVFFKHADASGVADSVQTLQQYQAQRGGFPGPFNPLQGEYRRA